MIFNPEIAALVRGKSTLPSSEPTLLGRGEPLDKVSAQSYLAALSMANGAKSAADGNISGAVSYYEAASTAESLVSAASLLKDLGLGKFFRIFLFGESIAAASDTLESNVFLHRVEI